MLGKRHGIAARRAAGDDRDLVDGILRFGIVGGDGVTGLVISGQLLFLVADDAGALLRACYDLDRRLLDILEGQRLVAFSGGKERRFVHQVFQVRTGKARRGPGHVPQGDILSQRLAAGVDFQGERPFWEVLDNARQQQGFTQLMVTHNLPLAAHYADHVIGLNKKVIAQGPPQQTLLAPTLMKLFGVPIHLYPNQCEHPEAACNKCGALCHALRMAPAGREDKGQRHA